MDDRPAQNGGTLQRVFFSFDYADLTRALVVSDCWVGEGREATGFTSAGAFVARRRRSESAVARWIDRQLEGATVAVVLVGQNSCTDRWVRYAIGRSMGRGIGLIGIDVTKIEDSAGRTHQRCGKIPFGFAFYLWVEDEGAEQIGAWIEDAAARAESERILNSSRALGRR